jgi:hypothetical protein
MKINISSATFFTVSLIVLFASCKIDIQTVNSADSYVDGNFDQVFEAFWNGMNNNYIFWSIDTTNWDGMYTRYKPLFDKLNINDTNDVKKSIQYFRQMTDGLVDSHYNLTFSYSSVADSVVDPAEDRLTKRSDYHPNYWYAPLDYYDYLDSTTRQYGYDTTTDATDTRFAMVGTIASNVLYFNFNEFELESSYQSNSNGVKTVLQNFFNKLQNADSYKAVIIDLRGNGGGSVSDLDFLLGRMLTSKLTFGSTRYKSGNGRLDYTPWAPAIVTPQTGAVNVTVPIYVLADIYSASMAELTTMAIHTLSNGKVVGERTWGANGPLAPNEYFNGGQFTAANFLFAYTSSSQFKYIDGNMYEGKGFPPDYSVPYNAAAIAAGYDPALEKILSLVE